jgi:hypothetical protein
VLRCPKNPAIDDRVTHLAHFIKAIDKDRKQVRIQIVYQQDHYVRFVAAELIVLFYSRFVMLLLARVCFSFFGGLNRVWQRAIIGLIQKSS